MGSLFLFISVDSVWPTTANSVDSAPDIYLQRG
jgi:hypothetical protein